MKEKLEEIYQGLKERLKSPFLITFIFVWIVHNWEFAYAIVTFNADMPYSKRWAILKAYLILHEYSQLIWLPLIWTFASICIYFIATFISEGIGLFYSKWVRTWLYLLIDKNKLKTEDDYDDLERRRKDLQELVFDLRRKEEDAALRVKNIELSLNKTINEQRDEIAKYINESVNREKTLLDITSELDQSKLNNLRIQDQMEKAKGEIELLKKQYDELNAFKSWIQINNLSLFESWKNRDTNDKLYELLKRNSNPKISDIFNGDWMLTYTKNGVSGTEKVTIKDGNKYYADNRYSFNIENFKVDKEKKKIFLTKVKQSDGKVHADEELSIINDFLITGRDSAGFTVEYRR